MSITRCLVTRYASLARTYPLNILSTKCRLVLPPVANATGTHPTSAPLRVARAGMDSLGDLGLIPCWVVESRPRARLEVLHPSPLDLGHRRRNVLLVPREHIAGHRRSDSDRENSRLRGTGPEMTRPAGSGDRPHDLESGFWAPWFTEAAGGLA